MRVEIKQNIPAEECFRYMERLDFPFQYHPDFARWEDSFLRDVDGEGRRLFLDLTTAGAYTDGPSAALRWHEMTAGRQRNGDFLLDGRNVGGCQVHFPEGGPAYLRWIFIEDGLCGKGLGTRCMAALKADLYRQGAVRLDTDTAMTNAAAQRFYEKTGFVRRGVTRSYVSGEV